MTDYSNIMAANISILYSSRKYKQVKTSIPV